jgi:hypothetical protein
MGAAKKATGIAAIAVCLALVLFWVARSSTFQVCQARHDQYSAYQQDQEGPLAFKWVWRNAKVSVRCGLEFGEINHGPLTALATIALAIFTTTLWRATSKLVKHTPQVERAYISGGGGYRVDPNTGAIDFTRFVLTVQNYGKTPGTVIAYAVFIVDRTNLPPRPAYLSPGFRPTRFHGVYQLGAPTQAISDDTQVSAGANPIAYGRFWYTDIFEKEHDFSFALPIRTPNDHAILAGIDPAYTEST